jgi:hypothetical protein
VVTFAALAVLVFGGVAIAGATQWDDDQPLSGQVAEQARNAGVKAAGGGSIVETERDVEDGRTYKVEVRKAGGTVVDVDLNSAFKVVAVESEREDVNERDDLDDRGDRDDANEREDRDDNDRDDANERDDQDDRGDDDRNEQADQDD